MLGTILDDRNVAKYYVLRTWKHNNRKSKAEEERDKSEGEVTNQVLVEASLRQLDREIRWKPCYNAGSWCSTVKRFSPDIQADNDQAKSIHTKSQASSKNVAGKQSADEQAVSCYDP